MNSFIRSCVCVGAMLAAGAIPAAAQSGTKVGTLSCDLSAGIGLIVTSSRTMSCQFVPARGRSERYTGTVRRFGLDIGATRRARMVWAVVAPVRRFERGALAGSYVGASAEGTLGVGAGANALVGGSNNTFSLQPVSLQTQRGLNLAVGVSDFTLDAVR